jgi:hypothetical protein
MTVSEILNLCCSTDPYRRNIHRPWRAGEWVYATDGHVLVRVPVGLAPEVGPWVCPENATKLEDRPPNAPGLDRYLEYAPAAWLPMPSLPAQKMETCDICEGLGRYVICADCDGSGAVEWRRGRHDYSAECQECDGHGKYGSEDTGAPCEQCGGTGRVSADDPRTIIQAGPWKIGIDLARKLAAMGADVASERTVAADPVLWRSGEHYGLFMPMED